jgi:hypothetical protein
LGRRGSRVRISPPRLKWRLAVLAVAAALAPGFHASVQPIPAAMRAEMTGVSWHRGCPVGLGDLRLITLTYRGFDGRAHTGRLVANRTAAPVLVSVFRVSMPRTSRSGVSDDQHFSYNGR